MEDDDDLDQFGAPRRADGVGGRERAGGTDDYAEGSGGGGRGGAGAGARVARGGRKRPAQQAALDDERKRMAQRAAAAEACADDLGRAQTFEAKSAGARDSAAHLG